MEELNIKEKQNNLNYLNYEDEKVFEGNKEFNHKNLFQNNSEIEDYSKWEEEEYINNYKDLNKFETKAKTIEELDKEVEIQCN
uniref:Uncharacterized protein n=1 Tax=Meloidogyne hapla TaxID=6305 RepID=A0A1I8BA34_MELHA